MVPRGTATGEILSTKTVRRKHHSTQEATEPAYKRARRTQQDSDYESSSSDNESVADNNKDSLENQFPTPLSPSPDPNDIRFILRPNIYHCTFVNCNRSFNRPCRLADHIRSHTGERPFVCQYSDCDKSFTRDSHLTRHIKTTHANIRNFPCTWEGCGKSFATGQRMRIHYASHEKYKDFTCTGYAPCREVFRKKTTLQAHIASAHLGVKPFPCPHNDETTGQLCNKGYDTQGKLNGHISKMHTGERYICTVCANATQTDSGISISFDNVDLPGTPASITPSMPAYAFPTFKLLQLHVEASHHLSCHHCHALMASNRDLASHIELIHPDAATPISSLPLPSSSDNQKKADEPQTFPCTFKNCLRVFTKRGNLNVHISIVHEKSKPFICNSMDLTKSKRLVNEAGERIEWSHEAQGCELGFGTKAMLENHIRMRHLGLGSWHSHLKRLQGIVSRGQGGGNKKRQDISAVSLLVGGAYEESGRDIKCLVDTCEYLFYREYDLRVHCDSKHGMAEVEIEERLREREALEGGVFWVGGPNAGGFGWYEDDENDYDDYEQTPDREQQDFPMDPALEERMGAVVGYVLDS